MCRIDGPFRRVRVVDRQSGKAVSRVYATEHEARAAIPKLRREYQRPTGVPITHALAEYEMYQRDKGNKPRSIQTTIGRLISFFAGVETTDDLTKMTAGELWSTFTTSITRTGKPPAFDTRANVLAQARTFVHGQVKRGG
jgi:hypothetical protein